MPAEVQQRAATGPTRPIALRSSNSRIAFGRFNQSTETMSLAPARDELVNQPPRRGIPLARIQDSSTSRTDPRLGSSARSRRTSAR